ncbi:MAG: lectin-like domain-containing protein, partial [Planctomycetaceae bacterium]
ADGIALVLQNEGLSALGNTGGALGYVGISGATAAYQVNLYSPHTVGTNFVTTNTSGTYQATGAVNVASGNPIDVVLVYDPAAQTLVETLTDTITLATFTKTHAGINLAGVLGDSCFLGFTGA